MSVARRLQIESEHRVAVLGRADDVLLDCGVDQLVDDPAAADALVVFARAAGDLAPPDGTALAAAAGRGALAWVAYPAAELDRSTLEPLFAGQGLRVVREVQLDETWSALRFGPA